MEIFNDVGNFYADNDMIKNGLIMSISSGYIYKVLNDETRKCIKVDRATLKMLEKAKSDIKNDEGVFYTNNDAYIYYDTLLGGFYWIY